MSECEKRFGDWRLFNPLRDAMCQAMSVSTTPPPAMLPAVPVPLPTVYPAYAPPEVAVREIVAVKPEEAPPAKPEVAVRAPPELEIRVEDWREFRKLGDINMDGVINERDLEEVKGCYGQRVGTEFWSVCAKCDLNGDGRVDMRDIGICSDNLGLTIYEWKAKK